MSTISKVSYNSELSVEETLTGSAVGSTNKIKRTGYNSSNALTPTSTPPVTKCSYFQQALTAGAAVVDLTSMVGGPNGDTVSFSGLKVRQVKLQAPLTNGNPIVVTPDGTNGYNLFGAASSITLQPGMEVLAYLHNAAATVGSGAKRVNLAGTGTDVLNIGLTAGA